MAYKPMWDWMDKSEGKKEGTSHKNLEKEMKRQGYKAKHQALKKKMIPKHYQGNTNSEGGIPFGKKPK